MRQTSARLGWAVCSQIQEQPPGQVRGGWGVVGQLVAVGVRDDPGGARVVALDLDEGAQRPSVQVPFLALRHGEAGEVVVDEHGAAPGAALP
jgi:hypothetical protein